MKYIVILGDGMADEPIEALGGCTPLECAATPVMDSLAGKGELGLAKTVPASMKPGSDVANLAVLGYDPEKNYSGRSPLEALSVGVKMESDDVVFRCNIVTLTEEESYGEKRILDHSSGEISTEEADILMDAVREHFNSDTFQFYTGTSYRHITVWKQGTVLQMEQPHDHLGEVVGPYLPKEAVFRRMMEESFDILNQHPVNQKRAAEGKNKANSLWFWGAGTKPSLPDFTEKNGVKAELQRLIQEKYLSPETRDAVRIYELERFFGSKFYRSLMGAAELHRETRFNIFLPASAFTMDAAFAEQLQDEKLLVQGVIDLFYTDANGKLVLCDYKTDRLSPEELANPDAAARKLMARHGEQLSYYAMALAEICGKAPDRILIYSLPLGEAVEVNLPK